jgi:hypothetical protein
MKNNLTRDVFILRRFMNRPRVVIVALMFFFAVCGTVRAELDNEEQAKVDSLAAMLQLSAAQKAAIAQERERSKYALLQLEKRWQWLHDELRREVRKNEPDQTMVDKISGEIGKIQGQIVALRTNSFIYLKSQLTPQQFKIIEDQPADASAGSKK